MIKKQEASRDKSMKPSIKLLTTSTNKLSKCLNMNEMEICLLGYLVSDFYCVPPTLLAFQREHVTTS